MPELYLKIYKLFGEGKIAEARQIQDACCQIIYKLCAGKGNMYAMIKAVLAKLGAPEIGSVRAPLSPLVPEDEAVVSEAAAMIEAALKKFI